MSVLLVYFLVPPPPPDLGRSGPFECYPEYTRYTGTTLEDDIPSVSFVRDSSATLQEDEKSEEEEEQSSVDDIDWEQVEPPSLMDMISNGDPLSPQRVELPDSYRERMMHLDYNSTYRDYAALGASERGGTPVMPSDSCAGVQHPEGARAHTHGSLFGKLSNLWGSISKPK